MESAKNGNVIAINNRLRFLFSDINLKSAGEQQQYQNQKDQAQPTTRIVPPLTTVWPRGKSAHKHQNNYDDQNCS
jgi:hypothetical protein